MNDYLSARSRLIDASGIRKVFALGAKLKDPVNLSIGQPDFDVPQELKQAAIEAIEQGFNRYSQTAGEQVLLDSIRGRVRHEFGWNEPAVMITSGVSGGLLLAFMSLIDPGDEVIVPDPYFVMYKHLIRMLGGVCVYIDMYPDFRLPAEKIRRAITDRTKMIILNSPANPTGAVYTEQEIKDVVQIAAEKDLLVLSDEIYDMFCYDDPFVSPAKFYDKTLVLKGFGKSYGMTGWRMGYAAASENLKGLIETMLKIQQYTFVCAPTPFQIAAAKAGDIDMSGYVKAYRSKRDLMYKGLSGDFELLRPAGTFYMFVKVPPQYRGATEFVQKAIENNVLVIPGNVFSEKDTHFRISYATTDEKLRQGIDILSRLAKSG